MRRTNSRLAVGGVLLSVALVAMGCGGNKKEVSSSTTGGSATPAISDGDSNATPTPGGTVTFGLEAESSDGWCLPEAQLAAAGIQVANAVYDPLMAYDENFEPQPYLAQSVTRNDAATQWTIKLRPGITFHDGSKLTASVVKLNLDLWKGDPEAKASTGRKPLLLPLVFADVGDVKAVDDLTVTVDMKRPWPAFANYLAGGRFDVAAEAQLRASTADCKAKPIGTGPFKFVSWDRNVETKLVRNPNYWMKDKDGKQLPYLDSLNFKPIPGVGNRIDALGGNAINMMHFTDARAEDQVLAKAGTWSMSKDTEGHREVAYGLVNNSRAPFNDLETRRALGMGLDRDRLNKVANEGRYKLANGPFDTKVMGYTDKAKVVDYNPDEARRILSAKKVTFTVTYTTDPAVKIIADEVQRQMDQIGVKVNLQDVDQSTLIAQAIGGNFDLLLFRNLPGTDPDAQYIFFYGSSPVNFGKIHDAELDKLWDDGRVELDQDARRKIYEKIDIRLDDQAYAAWNWFSEWRYAAVKDVHNFANYLLPNDKGVASKKGAGMNWGWSYLTSVWVQK